MTEATVSFAGNLTDDPEVRHTEAGIVRAISGWRWAAGASRRRRSSP
jgi:single-stranded DNA-binding protein